jgi:hypothetical protein
MLSTNSFKVLLAAGAMALVAGGASAATCNVFSNGDPITYTLTQGDPDAVLSTDCRSDLNDKNTLPAEGWILGASTPLELDDDPSNDVVLTINGQEWSISNPLGYTDIMIVLKQARSFGGFVLNTTKTLAGDWEILGPSESMNDYSHISVWHKTDVAPIPVPAAGFLMIGALGGLVALRRRRRAV